MMTDLAVHHYRDPPVPQLTLDRDPPVLQQTDTDPPVRWQNSTLSDPPALFCPQRMTMSDPAPAEAVLIAPSIAGCLILQDVSTDSGSKGTLLRI